MINIDEIHPRMLYSISELQYYSNIHYNTIKSACQKGKLKADKLGGIEINPYGTWRIKGSDFIKWATDRLRESI